MNFFSNPRLQTSEDARAIARRRLPQMAFDYFDGSAITEHGEYLARKAIKDIRLMPKVLLNVSNRNIRHSVFGKPTDIPFGIAPMGMCNLSHPRADHYIAKAGSKFNRTWNFFSNVE